MEEPGLAQILPQRGRYRVLQEVEIAGELARIARSRDDRRDRRVGERELQGRRRKRHAVALANRADRVRPGEDLRRRGPVVPGVAAGENAGIERPADDDRGARLLASRQEIVERGLF